MIWRSHLMYQSAENNRAWPPAGAASPRKLAGKLTSGLAGMRPVLMKVGALTLVGAAMPLLLTDSLPQKYVAETRLSVTAASEASVNDAANALRSKASLDNLIRALNLGNGKEFAVDRPTAVRVVSDIVSGDAMTMSQAESRMRDKLSGAISTAYDPRTGSFAISVTADEAGEAARIANMLAATFEGEMAASGSKMSEPVLEQLRQTLDRAEAALSGFIGSTDEHKLAELRRAEGEGEQLSSEIAEAEAAVVDSRQKAAQAAAMKLEDVLTRPLPDRLEYTGLEYQRQRHVEAKLAVDQLVGNLGPRHPRLVVAQGALADIRNDIQTTLRQLTGSLRQQEAAAVKLLADLKAKKARAPGDTEIAGSAAKLSALETASEEARRNYLDALQRSRSQSSASGARVGVVATATAAGAAVIGLSSMEVSGIGAGVGFCIGALLAFFTRRKPDAELEQEAIGMDEAALMDIRDWPDEGMARDELPRRRDSRVYEDREAPIYKDFDEEDDRFYVEPTPYSQPAMGYGSPLHYEQQFDRVPASHFAQDDYGHHPMPANDRPARYNGPAGESPFGDQIRDMLMGNRRPVAEANIPPLMSAVMDGRVVEQLAYSTRAAHEAARKAEEARELRRHMAELRERVEVYSAGRSSGRR